MQFYSGEFIRQILHKNIGGLITTPFWNYITISQYGTRIRERKSEKRKTTLQESMGAKGVQTLDANFDKSFVTAVWNFVVVSPGTFSWNNWGGNKGVQTLDANFDKSFVTAREADLGHVLLV